MKLVVVGGMRRENHSELKSGQKNNIARVIEIDTEQQQPQIKLDYLGESGVYPDELPGIRFTAACFYKNSLLTPTPTEVIRWDLKTGLIIDRISHPLMNDVHSVFEQNDKLYITSSGIDGVLVYDVLDKDWKTPIVLGTTSIEKKLVELDVEDLRTLHNTGAHEIHPNFVFQHQKTLWVTCGQTGSCWSEAFGFVKVSETVIHDGISHQNSIVFTSVDGYLHFFDPTTKRVHKKVRLNCPDRGGINLGWCRGLLFSEQYCFVAFSSSRPSNRKEMAVLNTDEKVRLPSHIDIYDINNFEFVSRVELDGVLDDVFSLHLG